MQCWVIGAADPGLSLTSTITAPWLHAGVRGVDQVGVPVVQLEVGHCVVVLAAELVDDFDGFIRIVHAQLTR